MQFVLHTLGEVHLYRLASGVIFYLAISNLAVIFIHRNWSLEYQFSFLRTTVRFLRYICNIKPNYHDRDTIIRTEISR